MLFVTFRSFACSSIFLRVFVAGSIRRAFILPDLLLVAGDLIFELADILSRATQSIRLAIKSFVAMTTHAAALVEKIASQIQRVSSLRNAILRVTLLAAGLSVFLFKHRPEPELVSPVALHFARRGAAVAPMATRATKTIGSVYLQKLSVWMTHERARETVGFLPRPTRRQVFSPQVERLADADVAHFAAIDDIEFIDADLMRQNGVIKLIHLAEQAVDLAGPQTCHVML